MRIDEGTYTARPKAWGLSRAGTGTDQAEVEFEIIQGPFQGCSIVWRGFFTEKTAERSLESLRYCGWQGDDIAAWTGMGSRNVEIIIEDKANQDGKVFPKVKWVNRLGSSGGSGGLKMKAPMDDAQKRQFAARIRDLARQVKALPPVTREPGVDDGPGEDDIGF